jgi:hypothetical protein
MTDKFEEYLATQSDDIKAKHMKNTFMDSKRH